MSDLFNNKYRIPSARLQTWNYANTGMYFITICTANRECYFGNIVKTRCIASLTDISEYEMQLNDLGKTVESEWLKTVELRPDMNLELAEYIVMPNHFHCIIVIGENQYNTAVYNTDRELEPSYPNTAHLDAMHRVPTDQNINNNSKNKFGGQSKNLASILRGFKSAVTTYARKNDIPFNWQARFHDHIITTNEEYLRIADYIVNNPNNWKKDKFYK
jgi:REP element-mobilizing transposase RayT